MKLREYQRMAMDFRLKSADPLYAIIGLPGEVGEVCSLAAKGIRDGISDREVFLTNMKKELGDVLWFIAAIADDFDLSLADIAKANIDKLASRSTRGVLGGSGDDR